MIPLKLTRQRKIILEELQNVKSHPTADELFIMVRSRLPKVSLATVYRNLEIMSECGIIRKLESSGRQKRFDGTAELHNHIRCVECGRVDDLDITPVKQLDDISSPENGYQVLGYCLEFYGICRQCQTKTNRKQ